MGLSMDGPTDVHTFPQVSQVYNRCVLVWGHFEPILHIVADSWSLLHAKPSETVNLSSHGKKMQKNKKKQLVCDR